MIFEIKNTGGESIPVGSYLTTFMCVERKERQDGSEMLVWRFHDTKNDREIVGFTDADKVPTPNNKLGRWLAALTGKPAVAGTKIDAGSYVGKKYLCMVGLKQDGQGTRLENFATIPSDNG